MVGWGHWGLEVGMGWVIAVITVSIMLLDSGSLVMTVVLL
jgi:hypothetical protein